MAIRIAERTDAAALLSIYRPYISTAITFEATLPTLAEFSDRISDTKIQYPYLVWADQKGQIFGYVYAHRFRERAAYQWSAELSIYVKMEHRSEGIGSRLGSAIVDLLKLQHVNMLYSGVTTPNPASEGLHAHLGFSEVGTYHRAGYKCGHWQDVKWFEKSLCEAETTPCPFVPFAELPQEKVHAIISGY